jgi:F-type H+-transporting ATPase subunit b
MEIDWLTVIAQIVNFLILVWLLKHFLYQPVISAMDRREQRITERLQQSELREQLAEETVQDYEKRMAALTQNGDMLMTEAREKAEAERQQLLTEARTEVAEKRSHWQRQVSEEKQRFLNSLKLQAAESIQAIARQALADLADTELEQQIIQSFILQLQLLSPESRQDMISAATTRSQPVHLMSSFKLDSALRGRLTRAIHEHIAEDIKIVYDEAPELLCGIELTVSGHRLSWNMADYLETLEQRMKVQLEIGYAAGE